MSAARDLLAASLILASGGGTVVPAPPRNAAPPVYAIAPGVPYMRPTTVPGCAFDWRFDVWCAVTREAVDALDQQDAMLAIVAEAVAMMPTGQFLGVTRANIATEDLAGVPTLSLVAEVRVTL